MKLYVGDNPIPIDNVACNTILASSGTYECEGLIGRYIGLYKAMN
jgi:hypothetical protein